MASSPITSLKTERGKVKAWQISFHSFLGSKITADGDCSHETRRNLLIGKKAMTKLESVWKSRAITFLTKVLKSQSYGFSSSHVWMWELDLKEGWAPKNWCFWIVVLEKTLESPLDRNETKTVHPKGNQPWIFIGKTDADTEAPILCPHYVKSRFIGKDSDAGKDWGQEEKGITKDKIVGWHHWLKGNESSKFWDIVKDREAWCATVHGFTKSQTWLRNWTTTSLNYFNSVHFSHSVMSDSIRPHGLQQSWPPCPSPILEFIQTHVHWVGDVIQSSHSLSSPSPTFNLSQHQGLFQCVRSPHQVTKVLEFQLQHQSFQWAPRTDLL